MILEKRSFACLILFMYFLSFFFFSEWLPHTHYCLTGSGPGRQGEITLSLPGAPPGTALIVYRTWRRENEIVQRSTSEGRDVLFGHFKQVPDGRNFLSYRLKLLDLVTNLMSVRFSKVLRLKFRNDELPKCSYKVFA